MEKININKIRGKYTEHEVERNEDGSISGGKVISAGDDTIKSIEMVVNKLNEVIDYLNNN